jgi:hypothetical protein
MTARVTTLLVAAAVAAAVAPLAAGARSPSARAAAAGTVTLGTGQKVYRGQGNRALGTLRLLRAAKLSWRHPQAGRLRLMTTAGRGRQFPLVITSSRTGSVRLRAGTYRGLRMLTRGGWRITLTVLKRT